nr:FAD-dependent oxidoreductase [Leucobacter exalbidus]
MRIAVIGTGTMGSQALWQLSQQDCDVVGYELYQPGHARGAAAGENRVFNFIELEDLRVLPMTDRADQLYRRLEEDSGVELRDLQGVLAIGEESAEPTQIALETARKYPDRFQVLSNAETRAKYPKFNIHDNEIAIFDKEGGIIFPDRTIQAASALAVENGAILHTEARVASIEQRDGKVYVTNTDQEVETFDRVVVAAGAWTGQLLPSMDKYFAMRRLISTWFRPKFRETMEGLPAYVRTEPNYSYGLPSPDGTALKVGLGFKNHLAIASPDSSEYTLSDADLLPLRNLVRDLFPSLGDYPSRFTVCHESYTKSRIEWVQPHPEMSNVLVMAGFSGKGFKNSPALGEIGARWALGLPTEPHAEFLFELDHLPFEETEAVAQG